MKLKLLTRLRGAALVLACVFFAMASLATAQAPYGYVTVSGSNIVDSTGNPEANGTITFAPVSNAGTPIGYRVGVGYGGVLGIAESGGALSGCTVSAVGSGYISAPYVQLSGGGGTGGTVTAAVSGGAITGCTASGGSGYTSGPAAAVIGYGQTTFTPVQANIVNGAFSLQIADTALTYPANVCFAVTAIDNVSGAQLLGPGYACAQPAGSGTAVTGSQAWCTASTAPHGGACDFDAYPVNIAALTLVTTGPAGPTGATGAQGASSITGMSGDGSGDATLTGTWTAQTDLTAQIPTANVLDLIYGAIGNGSTDDTAAIQSAFPATCGNQKFAVYIPTAPGGSYKITSPIVVNPNCTSRIEFDGKSAALNQATANQDALQISCGTAGNCNTKGFVLIRPAAIYTGSGTTSGAGIRFTGVAPGLSPTPVTTPPVTWNGDNAVVYDAYSSAFDHGIEVDGWGNIKFKHPNIDATATASAAQAITSGSCTGSGAGNCSITVTSGSGYSTSTHLYITGASPTALPSFSSYQNLLDSPFGLLSVGAFAGGTVTGTVGQTCLVSGFTTPAITGATATVTLTANVTAGPLTFQNSNSVAITNSGIALQGSGSQAPLSSGTATCGGSNVFPYAMTVGQIPFVVTNVTGNVITFTNPNVTTVLTFNTGGNNLPTAHTASPGSLFYITGSATNDIYIDGLNGNCGGGVLADDTAAIEWTAGGGAGDFSLGDLGNCDYLVLGQTSNSAKIDFGDIERQAGRYLQANSGFYDVTLRNIVTAVNGPGSPIVSNGATGTLRGPHGFGGSIAAITANNCYQWTYTDVGDTCQEETHGQISSGQLPGGPMSYPGTVPTFASAARDFLFWGWDYSGTDRDRLFVYRNIAGSLTQDQLLFATSPTASNPTFTGTTAMATATATNATIGTESVTSSTISTLSVSTCTGCTTTPNATMIARLVAPVNCTTCGSSPGTQVASLTIPSGTVGINDLLHISVFQSGCSGSAAPDAACTATNTSACQLNVYISATNTGTSYHLVSAAGTTAKEMNFEIDVQALGATNSENINLTSINFASSSVGGAFAVANPANINFATTEYVNVFLVDATSADRCVVPQFNIKHWVG